jgi:tRNA A37 threonylcarbamoyladenosine dehydratase
MDNPFLRTEYLYGQDRVADFANARVAVIGLGGVGSFAVEALARSGIGFLRLVDFDRIRASNLNRQLGALNSTLGRFKAEVARERVLEINPSAKVEIFTDFCGMESRTAWLHDIDFLVDAIDSLGPKAGLLGEALTLDVPIITIMGAAGRRDPSRVKLTDINQTRICPLASRVRKYLRRQGINKQLPCVWSDEAPLPQLPYEAGSAGEWELERGRKRGTLPSGVIVPAVMGLWAAGYVLEHLEKGNNQ